MGKAYIANPVLRAVANTIVWKQDKNTFILQDDKAICADTTPYIIGDSPILVAHPMEMTRNELSAWQSYFLNNSIKQGFEQIWEPVIDPKEVHKDRYDGMLIPFYRFTDKYKHGISIVYYGDYDGEKYVNEPTIYFKDCNAKGQRISKYFGTEFNISAEVKIEGFTFNKYTRMTNHIVAYLDKAVISELIKKDDVSVARYMHNLTLAQVMNFIELATQENSPNASAILLDYKNKNFADVDSMAEFTLEDL